VLSPPAARAPEARSSAAPPRAPAPGRAGDQDHVRHPEPAVERRAPLNGWRSVLRSLAATALGLGARSFDLAATLRETRARDETKALVREEQQQHACKSSSSAWPAGWGWRRARGGHHRERGASARRWKNDGRPSRHVQRARAALASGARPSTRELHAAQRAAVPNCTRRRVRERGRGEAGLGRRTHTRRAPKDGALLSQPGPRRRVPQRRGKKGTRSRELGTPRRPSRKIRDTRLPCPKGHFETAVSTVPKVQACSNPNPNPGALVFWRPSMRLPWLRHVRSFASLPPAT